MFCLFFIIPAEKKYPESEFILMTDSFFLPKIRYSGTLLSYLCSVKINYLKYQYIMKGARQVEGNSGQGF